MRVQVMSLSFVVALKCNDYLEVRDNGQGIPRDADGRPDFRYVATHMNFLDNPGSA
jgi:hypothetical protein